MKVDDLHIFYMDIYFPVRLYLLVRGQTNNIWLTKRYLGK